MSRVGKKPVQIPEKTKVTFKDKTINVEGPLGKLSRNIHPDIDLKIDNNEIKVIYKNNNSRSTSYQGLYRSLINNMVTGVSKGYERVLEINGIGYRADMSGDILKLFLGYSNPIDFKLPPGITATVDKKNNITLKSIDNELLGLTSANIRKLRPPEPYKGKGVKYAEENIQRKAGKTGAK